MSEVTNKVVIITGAGQGIGKGMALAFAKQGASVVLAGRTEKKVSDVAREIEALGGKAMAIRCDVAIHRDVKETVKQTVDAFGTVDVLINNAFCGNDPMPTEDLTEDYMQAAVNSNIFGCLHFMQACLPYLKKNGGSIINFASGAAIEGWANLATYAATKEAVRGMSRSVAKEWGQFGVRVNIISPQASSPAMERYSEIAPDQYAELIEKTPMGYIGDCEKDIAPVAIFLASDDSRYITGHTINVDGGLFVLR